MRRMSDSIYKRIVEARKSAGLDASQVAIARDLGIAQSNVSYWKSGGKPKIEHALKIAFVLKFARFRASD